MFEYSLKFKRTAEHANADALSRLPLPVEPATTETPPELVLLADHMSESPVTATQIRSWTRKDPELSLVVQFLQQGWPSKTSRGDSPKLAPFLSKKISKGNRRHSMMLSLRTGNWRMVRKCLYATTTVVPGGCPYSKIRNLLQSHHLYSCEGLCLAWHTIPMIL